MKSIVFSDTPELTGRILVIEADACRATALRDILRHHDGIDVEIVGSVADAFQSLAEQIPDLLLTSTFLPPPDEAALTTHLNQVPAARHLQTITVPYFIDGEEATSETSGAKVLTFLRRRPASTRPRCDVRTLREQIEEYLSRARTIRLEADGASGSDPAAPWNDVPAPSGEAHDLEVTATPGPLVAVDPAAVAQPAATMPADRRRAPRRASGDVPWLWTVKLPGSSRVNVVDISSTGVLLETASRLADGSTVDLQLLGQDMNITVPARMVRIQAASVDGLGVKYRVAAAFAHHLTLPGLQQTSAPPPMPSVLAELLVRTLSHVDRCPGEAALCLIFEQELRRILPVRDIQIRHTPVIAEQGSESVYFTVPHGSGAQPILQAIFEPDYAPTAMDFRLLKAAASLAAVVLEFAPR